MKTGYISYINSFPFCYDAENDKIQGNEITKGKPAALNKALYEAKLDLSAISAFEYLKNQRDYYLMSDMCIQSSGQVRSVLLYSHVELNDLHDKKIALTNESATSVHLLKVLLNEKGLYPEAYITLDDKHTIPSSDALLLIGDRALEFDATSYKYVYDLSDQWNEMAGYPVVFAVWALRKDSSVNKDLVLRVLDQMKETRRLLLDDAEHYIQIMKEKYEVLPEKLDEYFKNLNFEFNEKCQKSLELYSQYCFKHNYLTFKPTLEFYPHA